MRKFEMEPEARIDLFVTMEAFLGYVKSLHATLGAVMSDVTAIRNTVFDDPEEVALYRSNLKMTLNTARPMVDEVIRSYDEILEEITGSQKWEN